MWRQPVGVAHPLESEWGKQGCACCNHLEGCACCDHHQGCPRRLAFGRQRAGAPIVRAIMCDLSHSPPPPLHNCVCRPCACSGDNRERPRRLDVCCWWRRLINRRNPHHVQCSPLTPPPLPQNLVSMQTKGVVQWSQLRTPKALGCLLLVALAHQSWEPASCAMFTLDHPPPPI